MPHPRRLSRNTEPLSRRGAARQSCAERVTVTTLGRDGHGRAIASGVELSIPNVIPGEVVDVEIPPATVSARGRPRLAPASVRVIEPSRHRVIPRCRHALVCGGCGWQHIAYDEQLRLKRATVRDELQRALGEHAPAVEPVIATHREGAEPALPPTDAGPGVAGAAARTVPWGYRHKVSFVCTTDGLDGAFALGHFAEGGQRAVPVVECPVHADAGNAACFAIRDLCREFGVPAATTDGRRGVLRHIVARVGAASGEVVVTLVVTDARDRRLGRVTEALASGRVPLHGVHVNVLQGESSWLFGPRTTRVAGSSWVREQIDGVSFLIEPTAFFQTNVAAAAAMVRIVAGAMPPPSCDVLDVYAGVGLFALPLARAGHRVIAIEERAGAITAGEKSARLNGIDEQRCRFVCARVEDVLERFAKRPSRSPRGGRPATGVVILDPPRAGCAPRVLETIARDASPDTLLYVSCDPRALGRDLSHFLSAARQHRLQYRIALVQPVDMFPHTAHVETIAVLQRDSPRDGGPGPGSRRS